jgi:histidinol-phosphate aminotransferase
MSPAFPRPGLREVEAYAAPQLDVQVRLNTNECPYPLPEAFREDLAEAIRALTLNRYPPREADELRERLGGLHGHPVDGTWVANGSNEVILQLLLAYGGPGRRVVVFEPTYALHSRVAWVANGEVLPFTLGEPWRIGEADAAAALSRSPDVVFVCSPNNPTGNAQPVEVVAQLASGGGVLVVVDEAYVEFGGESALGLVAAHPNVVVVRTFSKAFALAGARIGYCLAAREVVEDLRRVRLPYHLSALTQAAGLVARAARPDRRRAAGPRRRGVRLRSELRAVPPAATRRPDLARIARPRRPGPRLLDRGPRVPAGDRRHTGGGRPVPFRPRGGPGMTRTSTVERTTKETSIRIELTLDGSGTASADTGLPFFDHMLQQLGTHAGFDLTVTAKGDLEVDGHHTVEDVGIALGQALTEALGDKRGIRRFASITVPLDEAAVEVALDLSGRPFVVHEVDVPAETIGTYDTGLTEDFVRAFAASAEITVHVRLKAGRSPHHVVEAEFKALAKCLQDAVRIVGGDVPSTKGTL